MVRHLTNALDLGFWFLVSISGDLRFNLHYKAVVKMSNCRVYQTFSCPRSNVWLGLPPNPRASVFWKASRTTSPWNNFKRALKPAMSAYLEAQTGLNNLCYLVYVAEESLSMRFDIMSRFIESRTRQLLTTGLRFLQVGLWLIQRYCLAHLGVRLLKEAWGYELKLSHL